MATTTEKTTQRTFLKERGETRVMNWQEQIGLLSYLLP